MASSVVLFIVTLAVATAAQTTSYSWPEGSFDASTSIAGHSDLLGSFNESFDVTVYTSGNPATPPAYRLSFSDISFLPFVTVDFYHQCVADGKDYVVAEKLLCFSYGCGDDGAVSFDGPQPLLKHHCSDGLIFSDVGPGPVISGQSTQQYQANCTVDTVKISINAYKGSSGDWLGGDSYFDDSIFHGLSLHFHSTYGRFNKGLRNQLNVPGVCDEDQADLWSELGNKRAPVFKALLMHIKAMSGVYLA